MAGTLGVKEQSSGKSETLSPLLLALQSLAARIPKIILPRIEEVYPDIWTGTVKISNKQISGETYLRNIKAEEEHGERREKALSNISGVNGRKSIEEIQKSNPCYICNRNFENDMINHLKSHNLNLIYCKVCNEFCKDVFSLNEHYKIHLENSQHGCEVCGKKFLTYHRLKEHKVIHVDISPFECKTCAKRFKNSKDLRVHSLKHSKEHKYVCDKCDKSFRWPSPFYKHKKLCHIEEKSYICNKCDERFKLVSNMKVHMLLHKNEKSFVCKHCNKQFTTKSTLKKHNLRIHLKIRNYECKECGKKFCRNIEVVTHMRQHTGEKRFVCECCNRQYAYKHHLKTHILSVHLKIRNYICKVCGKKYTRNNHLVSHMKHHTGEKPIIFNK